MEWGRDLDPTRGEYVYCIHTYIYIYSALTLGHGAKVTCSKVKIKVRTGDLRDTAGAPHMDLLYLCVKHRDNGFHLRGKN